MAAFPPRNSIVQHSLGPSQVPHCTPNSVLHTRSSKLQTCPTPPLPLQDNLFQKPVVKSKPLNSELSINVSSVGKTIKKSTDDGSFVGAIKTYLEMLEHGLPLAEFRSFPLLIKAFGELRDIKKGRQIHGHLLKLGVLDYMDVSNSLLSLLLKCGAIGDAVQLFEKMPERDPVSWNSMICGFYKLGYVADSLIIFSRMIWEFGMFPNRVACVSALSSCSSLESLIHGREIHCFVVKSGLDVDKFVINALIEMYMKCGDPAKAEQVFQNHTENDSLRVNVVIWNVMILGYVSNGCYSQAVELFIEMLMLGMKPDSSTIVAVLVLCSKLMDIVIGRQIHGFILTLGLDHDIRVQTALLGMYFKCGDAEDGLKIFERFQARNLVMWGTVISNCSQSACPMKALELFHIFRLSHGFADSVILLAVLRACSSLILKVECMEVHSLIVKTGFESNVFVGGALVDAYAKCKEMESSQKVFSSLQARDLISYNALISGYAQNDLPDEALRAFRDMPSEKIRPNAVTAASLLSVSSYMSVINPCKEVHGYIIRNGIELNVLVINSLIATYAKCGYIDISWSIFKRMNEINEESWNSIIHGFAMHGRINEMFALFKKMKASSMKPDHITFTAILSACSHTGRVDEGWKYFRSMAEEYKLEPQLEQYTCMVDLLGRAGLLYQAYNLIMTMPHAPDDRIWGSLLGSSKIYGDEGLAESVANEIFKLDPGSAGYHVLLANLYEDFEKWDEVNQIRLRIKTMGLKKKPGCSWIEIDNKIHVFLAGDKSHHFSEEIYETLENLAENIMGARYSTSTALC